MKPPSASRLLRPLPVLLLVVLLGACASTPPPGLQGALPDAPGPAAVQAAAQRHAGQRVQWGGEILGVTNRADATDVEIYARPLLDNAEPEPEGGEGVRFLARVDGFLDPAEYQAGKRMTVRGLVDGSVTRPVGEYPYRYPLVRVEAHHLWPVYQPPEPAWVRDPYYDPWWPWGPWGWGPWYHRPPYWW